MNGARGERAARSVLATPGSNRRMAERAVASAADMVFLDLEDAVAPAEKAAARAQVVAALRELDWGAKPRMVRVNGLGTPFFYRDLIEVVEGAGGRLDLVLVPKVERPEDVYVVATLLAQIEAGAGLTSAIGIEAQIETAEGLTNCERIARASPRLEALVFGPGDYAASVRMPVAAIGAADAWDEAYGGHRFHYPMHRLLAAGRAAGVRVIDGPLADVRDEDGLRRSARTARALGYDGKWCIHPGQIPVVNEVFTPTEAEVAWASRVVGALGQAVSEGRGAVALDGTMLDAASARMAEATLARARAAGIRDAGEGAAG